ncbi:30S ribosomal protein S12 methylthiotransferase RimO [Caproiciproducens sp. CPB-2]|uniref:30S ribosomal protein S12 methylthiotransferase RimO n=1 Tax=Caproiciproducens sp. CPB-2 TaxID=3030017 RepID=UPI0023DC3BF9|nr:30S ribosomal protein S12 methylthiotransferase RimO [Caproiciproducens sp. CPB-2]MDF1493523.1 30S ribosomal protein S12 methylthiotransferase RimO [Caproiciproducens sp. CPB-2]
MAYSVGLVSLGCAKNQVDGEMMMAALQKAGYEIRDAAALADAAIVNTCGFIDAAKKESIEEILELARLKAEGKIRAIVVTGCMAERYREEILKELPEVDAVAGIGADSDIAAVIEKALDGVKVESFPEKTLLPLSGERRLSTPGYFAYLKIAEGCDNRCAYCAIPFIRGPYRSRTEEDIVSEARDLVRGGAKELILIAQDTTRYGWDLYGELRLPKLLRELCKIGGLSWIRVLYCYPDYITDELLTTIAQEEKIVNYMDLPLQHCSERLLKAMRRTGSRAALTALIRRMREKIPGLVLRTTLITGFPGETEEDFTELAEFVREIRFERLGCFTYSQEEGTAAAEMPGQIDEDVKSRRMERIMEDQMNIMQEWGEKQVGKTYRVLVEGFDRCAGCWFGRSYADSPDIDGKIFFTAKGARPKTGSFADVKITECVDCDLTGEIILEEERK